MLCEECAHYHVCINRIIDNAYACDEGVADLRAFKPLANIKMADGFDNILVDVSDSSLRISFFKDNKLKDEKIISLTDFSKPSLHM